MGSIVTQKVMAKGTFISENLTELQLALFKYLNDHEILYFRLKELEFQLPERLSDKVNELVENLHHKGLQYRVERGVYARANYSNVRVLATFISGGGAIAYWSALHHHGLTERFPTTIFVKTAKRKRDTQIMGTPIRFVTVKSDKHKGTIQTGYDDDSYLVTDLNMTLVDCFDQPRYAGGFEDLVAAFARAELSSDALIAYTELYNNISLIKRMAYLATLFHKERLEGFIAFAKAKLNQKYTLMDPSGADQGEFLNEWKLRLNVTEEQLRLMAQSEY